MPEQVRTFIARWMEKSNREWASADEVLRWSAAYGEDWQNAWMECPRADALVLLSAIFGELPDTVIDLALDDARIAVEQTASVVRWPREALSRACRWREQKVKMTDLDVAETSAILEALRSPPPRGFSDEEVTSLSETLVRLAGEAINVSGVTDLTSAITTTCNAIVIAHEHVPALRAQFEAYLTSQGRLTLANATSAVAYGVSAASAARSRARAIYAEQQTQADGQVWKIVRREATIAAAFDAYHTIHHALAARAFAECSNWATWDQGTIAFSSALARTSMARRIDGVNRADVPYEARRSTLNAAIDKAERRLHRVRVDALRANLAARQWVPRRPVVSQSLEHQCPHGSPRPHSLN